MDRQQNIRLSGTRRVGANFTLDGKSITQNKGGGVVQITGNISPRSCGCLVADGIDICSCQLYQKELANGIKRLECYCGI